MALFHRALFAVDGVRGRAEAQRGLLVGRSTLAKRPYLYLLRRSRRISLGSIGSMAGKVVLDESERREFLDSVSLFIARRVRYAPGER